MTTTPATPATPACGHLACGPTCTAYAGKGHAYCTHEATKAARAACRRSGGAAANADADTPDAIVAREVARFNAAITANAAKLTEAPAPVDHAAIRHTALDASKELGFTKLGMDDMPGVFPLTSCRGANHSDELQLGYCDGCGARVTRTHRRTLIENWSRYCFGNAHVCDEARAEAHRAEQAAQLEAGVIVKGATVVVARGRKVAKGTTGIVFWLGTDSYGNDKLGFKADGESHFTATKNCDLA